MLKCRENICPGMHKYSDFRGRRFVPRGCSSGSCWGSTQAYVIPTDNFYIRPRLVHWNESITRLCNKRARRRTTWWRLRLLVTCWFRDKRRNAVIHMYLVLIKQLQCHFCDSGAIYTCKNLLTYLLTNGANYMTQAMRL